MSCQFGHVRIETYIIQDTCSSYISNVFLCKDLSMHIYIINLHGLHVLSNMSTRICHLYLNTNPPTCFVKYNYNMMTHEFVGSKVNSAIFWKYNPIVNLILVVNVNILLASSDDVITSQAKYIDSHLYIHVMGKPFYVL